MSTPKLTKPQIRQKAKEVVDELLAEYGEEFCSAVLQELSDRVRKPLGRRPAADWDLLLEMARRLDSGMAENVKDAARGQAHRITDVAKSTAIDRLRNNYSKFRVKLEAEVHAEAENEEDKVIAPAFEEDVETWDI